MSTPIKPLNFERSICQREVSAQNWALTCNSGPQNLQEYPGSCPSQNICFHYLEGTEPPTLAFCVHGHPQKKFPRPLGPPSTARQARLQPENVNTRGKRGSVQVILTRTIAQMPLLWGAGAIVLTAKNSSGTHLTADACTNCNSLSLVYPQGTDYVSLTVATRLVSDEPTLNILFSLY